MKTEVERNARIDELLRIPARNPRYGSEPIGDIVRRIFRPARPDPIKPPKKPRAPADA